ncbi:hypothetical protein B296_00027132 [Ensete ventricosum]|uniref:Secreted protein n=1 Tax=Ensete ventricosum TaxID=4639 RepID=A0A426ZXM4_ENSVE|nr:hypothetical protein B296_00027132 [Ensete ventricosum]
MCKRRCSVPPVVALWAGVASCGHLARRWPALVDGYSYRGFAIGSHPCTHRQLAYGCCGDRISLKIQIQIERIKKVKRHPL